MIRGQADAGGVLVALRKMLPPGRSVDDALDRRRRAVDQLLLGAREQALLVVGCGQVLVDVDADRQQVVVAGRLQDALARAAGDLEQDVGAWLTIWLAMALPRTGSEKALAMSVETKSLST